MAAILIHVVLILDLPGCQHVSEAIDRFLQQGDLAKAKPVVDSCGQHCTIRHTVAGPETLTGLRQKLKHMAKGLHSDACGGYLSDPTSFSLVSCSLTLTPKRIGNIVPTSETQCPALWR